MLIYGLFSAVLFFPQLLFNTIPGRDSIVDKIVHLHYKLRMSRYDPGSLSIMHSLDALAKYDPHPLTEDLSDTIFKDKEQQLSHFVQNVYRALKCLCQRPTLSIQDLKNLVLIYFQTVRLRQT